MGHAKQPPRATVWWDDAHSVTLDLYDHSDLEKSHNPYIVGTTGWLLQDDAAGVSIAYSFNVEQKELGPKADYRGHHFIPRGMIRRIEYLEPVTE